MGGLVLSEGGFRFDVRAQGDIEAKNAAERLEEGKF